MASSHLLLEDPLARVHLNLIDLIHRAVGPFRLSYIKDNVVHTLGDLEDERLTRQRSMSPTASSFTTNTRFSPCLDAGNFSPMSCTPPNSTGHGLYEDHLSPPRMRLEAVCPETRVNAPRTNAATAATTGFNNGEHTLIESSPSRRLNDFDTDALIAYHLTKVESASTTAKATESSVNQVKSTEAAISEWAVAAASEGVTAKNWGIAKPESHHNTENARTQSAHTQSGHTQNVHTQHVHTQHVHTQSGHIGGRTEENVRVDNACLDHIGSSSWPRVNSPTKKSMNNAELFESLMSRWNLPQTAANVKLIEGYGDLIWALPSDQLRAMTVNLCKRLFASRRRMYPYRKGVPPPQWPHGLRYTDPCHLLVRERVVLVTWILLDPAHNLAQFQDSIRELASDIPVDNIFCLIQYAYQVRMELFTLQTAP